jgi:ferredoxin
LIDTVDRSPPPVSRGFMRVIVDLQRCEANGLCMGVAPDIFDLTDDDELTLLAEYPDESQRAAIVTAVQLCPRQAITLEEDA